MCLGCCGGRDFLFPGISKQEGVGLAHMEVQHLYWYLTVGFNLVEPSGRMNTKRDVGSALVTNKVCCLVVLGSYSIFRTAEL